MDYEFVKGGEELAKKNYSAWEFFPGKTRDETNDNSVFLYQDGIDLIIDMLDTIDPNCEYYGYSATYNKAQVEKLKELLLLRIKDIQDNKKITFDDDPKINPEYVEAANENIANYKNDILNLLGEFHKWLSSITDELTYVSF